MNLVIDQGNSAVKMALFDSAGTLREEAVCTGDAGSALSAWLDDRDVRRAVYSTVLARPEKDPFFRILRRRVPGLLVFDHTTPLPVSIGYRTPETLGRDRIAAIVGAVTEKPGSPCLVIDAGTAVTYDFVTAAGVFAGGNIAPGCRARLRALHDYTGRLPLVEPDGELPLLGFDTPTAIRSGVLTGMLFEMQRYIETLRGQYPGIFVFLTGGDSKYFAAKLKNSIFADRILVLKGLNRILNEYAVRTESGRADDSLCATGNGKGI